MKNSVITFIIVALVSLTSNYASSQENCDHDSFFLTNGSKWVYNDYRKDKLVSTTTTYFDTVIFHEDSTEFNTRSYIKYTNSNDSTYSVVSKGNYICTGNKIYLSTEYIESDTTGMTVKYQYLEIPSHLNVGQNLKGVEYSYANIYHAKIYDRKVIKKETIETSAGSFDCYVITYNMHAVVYGVIFNRSIKEWYSPQVGFVQTETYNKKGKLKQTKILIEFSK